MTASALDPGTALLVVDLQRATTSLPSAHDMDGVIANAVRLAGAFRQRDLPVVLVSADLNRPPAGRTELGGNRPPIPEAALALVPQLDPQPADLRVVKSGWGAFAGTDLAGTLTRLGVTQVVIAGVATTFGVESTARQAYDLGFTVTVVVDAVTDPRAEAHEQSVARVFPVLGETATTEEVLALLPIRA
ncbi:isochorismatase family protein [Amycolatopsis sp. cg9]|uniref:isochorismatase family protein n=1 Tax=Amycolatopsis sp. cg9 TaxID=3238801 RepID=UPI003524F317